jgi:Zn-dependent M28 family amino/carboxypeptidase
MSRMPGRSHRGPLPPPTAAEESLRRRLEGHVRALAGEIGERHLWRPEALAAAAGYVEAELAAAGLAVAGQEYTVEGRVVRNLVAEIPGTSSAQEIVVVGAHYDTVPGTPGANDNGSGVAVLLELACLLAGERPDRTLRLVAFVNEEPPFFQTEAMGSRVHARAARQRGERIVAMLSLETLGCYDERPGSQFLPTPLLRPFYPDRGDFVAFVSNLASRSLLRRTVAAFRRHTPFPAEGLAAPAWITGVDWSDQWSFWEEGYPALMVTDTALFRYPHYHAPGDTPGQLDYLRLARVTAGLAATIRTLAQAE